MATGGQQPETSPSLASHAQTRHASLPDVTATETPEAVKQSKTPSEIALHVLSPDIESDLDVDIILPHLLKCHLLTKHQEEHLNLSRTRTKKARDLITWLPKKGTESFDLFTTCLIDSSEGHKSHLELAKKLKAEKEKAEQDLAKRKGENSEKRQEAEEELQAQQRPPSPGPTSITDEVVPEPVVSGYQNQELEPLADPQPDGNDQRRFPGNPVNPVGRFPGNPYCWIQRKYIVVCYSILAAIAVVLFTASFVVPLYLHGFDPHEVWPPRAKENMTVELEFSLSNKYLQHGTISINQCDGYLYVADSTNCRKLREKYTYSYSICNDDTNFNLQTEYWLPNSSIQYTLSRGITREVWLISSLEEYNKIRESIHILDCSNSTSPLARCFIFNNSESQVEHSFTIPIDRAANYFIAIKNESGISLICVNWVVYDTTKISLVYSNVSVSSVAVHFSFGKAFTDSCVIFSVSNGLFCHVGTFTVQVARYLAVFMVYGAILPCVVLIVIACIVSVHFFMCCIVGWNRRRRGYQPIQ